MEFRWAAAIALWTMLSGPVFGPPASRSSARPRAAVHASRLDRNARTRHTSLRTYRDGKNQRGVVSRPGK